MALIFSAFPGTGKSTLTKNAEQYGLKHASVTKTEDGKIEIAVPKCIGTPVFDSDSSLFDKEHFPGNYIEHVQHICSTWPNAVILMSSHDNVREALKENGIAYTICYPQRELKAEFLERYVERGSPEKFVELMDNKWNDFIDTCESDDAAVAHIVLSEGDHLVDKIYDAVKDAISKDTPVFSKFEGAILHGNESIGDIVTNGQGTPVAVWGHNGLEPLPETPEVVTVEADNGTEVSVNGENGTVQVITPAGGVSVGSEETVVMSEGNTVTTIDNETGAVETQAIVETVGADTAPEVPAEPATTEPTIVTGPIDTVTVDGTVTVPAADPATVDGSEAIDQPIDGGEDNVVPPEEEVKIAERAEMIEAHFDMQNDIDTLDNVVLKCADEEVRAGIEGLEDNGSIMVAAVADIKERYGAEVEPTLAGLEGFLESIKGAFEKLGEKIKGQPDKSQLAQVKKYLYEAEKAFLNYGTDKWIKGQKLINVGKVKLQVPEILKDIQNPKDAESILDLINKRALDAFKAHDKNTAARVHAGIKIFNQFKKKPADTDLSELTKVLPIKPEALGTGGSEQAGVKNLDTHFVAGEFPVLNADNIKAICKVVEGILDTAFVMLKSLEGYEDKTISETDFWDSDFFDEHIESDAVEQVIKACAYGRCTDQLQDIDYMYGQKLLNVCKFMEMWILQSVK